MKKNNKNESNKTVDKFTDIDIIIRPNGSVELLSNTEFDLSSEFSLTKTRASWVEPTNLVKRIAFRLIRALVSDDSRLAKWTRVWRGPWRANVIEGPIIGPFDQRQEAIDAEIEWLIINKLS